MGQQINLNTSGTQCIGAYVAKPEGKPKGGIVVVQEIFGVNAHIRSVADGFAAQGYTAIAPAFFDHIESDVELRYDPADYTKGISLVGEVGFDRAVEDVASAAESIASAGKIGVVGYCWGGTVALLSAIRLGLPAVSYYGGRNVAFLAEKPRAPVMFHFGEKDTSIPPEAIHKQREAFPRWTSTPIRLATRSIVTLIRSITMRLAQSWRCNARSNFLIAIWLLEA